MAEIQVGSAITAGFDVIRSRPLAVVMWGLVQLVVTVIIIALFAPFYVALFKGMATSGPAAMAPGSAAMAQMMQMQGVSYLVNIVSVAANAVLYCAVFRAVQHPEQSAFGYMRLGAPELFTVLLLIGGYIALVIGAIVVAVPIGIVVGILVATHATLAAAIVGSVAIVAALVALVYVVLRFSMVVPMMVEDGQFHLMESWVLTKGKVGSLFIIALVVFLLLLVAEIVVFGVLFVLGVGAVGALAGGMQNVSALFSQPPATILTRLAPLLVVLAIIWTPLVGCAFAIMGAPWAKAYRDLVQADVSRTFA
jgi:hypothetical protein